MDEKRIAVIFKAFCDENRVKIIELLRHGEKCACKLLEELNISQPTLSHHMKFYATQELLLDGRGNGHYLFLIVGRTGKAIFTRIVA